MNKAQLIKSISQKTGETKVVSSYNLDCVLSAISESLTAGVNVTLVGFGTFRVVTRSARMGINPLTKKPLKIPAARVARFTAGQALKTSVASK